jgi:hypothetical protein
MGSRIKLHNALQKYVGSEWTLYYQAPDNIQLKYPCIIYFEDSDATTYADNKSYRTVMRYQVTFIHKELDKISIPDTIHNFEMCSFERKFISDNLYHEVFNIFC